MKPSDERLAEFNGRMNEWIAKQGLIFQLTHGGTGLGGRPPIIGSIIRAFASLVLLALLATVGYGGFLFWKASGDSLPKELEPGITAGLSASEIEMGKFERSLTSGSYKTILAVGGKNSFYNQLSVRDITFSMEPTSGLFGSWDAQALRAESLSVSLKAGETSLKAASDSYQSLFQERPDFTFSQLEVKNATLTWGYAAPATWGGIYEAQLAAERTEQGWKLVFKGGTFSQGIFRNLQIKELHANLLKTGGLEVTKAELIAGEGTFSWTARTTSGGATPKLEVTGTLTRFPLTQLLPSGISKLVNGAISGDVTAEGTTNGADGICFQIAARPDGEGLILTHELPVLAMLSHFDSARSYRKIYFTQGSFDLKTTGSKFDFQNIDLSAPEEEAESILATLKGSFTAQQATTEDLKNETAVFDQIAQNTSATIGIDAQALENENLKQEVLRQFSSLQFENTPKELFFLAEDPHAKKASEQSDEEQMQTRFKRRLTLINRRSFRIPFVVEGLVELSVPKTTFQRIGSLPSVQQDEDQELARISIPLSGLAIRSSKKLSDIWQTAMETTEFAP